MSTIRTDAGQAAVDISKQLATAPQKAVVGNASTTVRTDAAGTSEGTTEKLTHTSALVSE